MAPAETAVTPPELVRWKQQGRKISVLTAYDYPMARLLDQAGIDALLVGDTLGMVVQGRETTLRVTLDQIIYHAEMVARAARRALVIADLPFLTYQASVEQAMQSAGRVLKETESRAIKLEGGVRSAPTIRALVDAGIPVMGHVGLTPQSVHQFGGFKVQRDADAILADAHAVADAGAFALVLECIPSPLAERITAELTIPTIGIGAGPRCDGQVLVLADVLGLFDEFRPRFARQYANLGATVRDAAAQYAADIASGAFPTEKESFR